VFTAAGGADRLAVTQRSRRGASLPGMPGDDSSLTRRQVLAPTPGYTEFETFTLVRARSDRSGRTSAAPQQAGAPSSG
jgi:hypothetical protein